MRSFPHNDQLSTGLITQMVGHCTGIAEVREGPIPVETWLFQDSSSYNLSSFLIAHQPSTTWLHSLTKPPIHHFGFKEDKWIKLLLSWMSSIQFYLSHQQPFDVWIWLINWIWRIQKGGARKVKSCLLLIFWVLFKQCLRTAATKLSLHFSKSCIRPCKMAAISEWKSTDNLNYPFSLLLV